MNDMVLNNEMVLNGDVVLFLKEPGFLGVGNAYWLFIIVGAVLFALNLYLYDGYTRSDISDILIASVIHVVVFAFIARNLSDLAGLSFISMAFHMVWLVCNLVKGAFHLGDY